MKHKHNYKWFFNYNKEKVEGQPDVSLFIKLFKKVTYVKAWKEKSKHKGFICVNITTKTKPDMRKALTILKENNFIRDIEHELNDGCEKIK